MLTAAVKGLDHLEQLVPTVKALGRRHGTFGVTDAHYETVASALLWTLEMGLGAPVLKRDRALRRTSTTHLTASKSPRLRMPICDDELAAKFCREPDPPCRRNEPRRL